MNSVVSPLAQTRNHAQRSLLTVENNRIDIPIKLLKLSTSSFSQTMKLLHASVLISTHSFIASLCPDPIFFPLSYFVLLLILFCLFLCDYLIKFDSLDPVNQRRLYNDYPTCSKRPPTTFVQRLPNVFQTPYGR